MTMSCALLLPRAIRVGQGGGPFRLRQSANMTHDAATLSCLNHHQTILLILLVLLVLIFVFIFFLFILHAEYCVGVAASDSR